MNPTRQHTHQPIAHLLLTVVGLIGIAGLFLPFAWGTSPMDAVVVEQLWRLALPFFLTALVSAASIRWIISGWFSGPERAIAYVASASMAGVTLSLWFTLYAWPSGTQEWLSLVIPVPIIALGAYSLIRNTRVQASRGYNPVLALQTAYLANAMLCLIAFFGDWEIGAYCVLIAALAFVPQMILASAQLGRLRGGDRGAQ